MISGLVFSTLRGLVNNRCYPNTFKQNDRLPIWPAIRYTLVSSDPAPDICGTADVMLDDVRVQLDIVAETYGAAVTLRDQVIAALMTLTPPPTRSTYFETFDVETKTERITLEYLFQQSSALTGSPT